MGGTDMTARKVKLCAVCIADGGDGHYSEVDGRWVSHAPRVESGRLGRDGKPTYIIAPGTKLFTRVERHSAGGCWDWLGPVNNKGYGTCRILGERYAHRASWVLHNGPITAGLIACHRCDNPRCCNPAHMFLGTLADNHADMMAKGRGAKRQTHCKRGHDWAQTPPLESQNRDGSVKRQCRVCTNERYRRRTA